MGLTETATGPLELDRLCVQCREPLATGDEVTLYVYDGGSANAAHTGGGVGCVAALRRQFERVAAAGVQTLRDQLVDVPANLATSAQLQTLRGRPPMPTGIPTAGTAANAAEYGRALSAEIVTFDAADVRWEPSTSGKLNAEAVTFDVPPAEPDELPIETAAREAGVAYGGVTVAQIAELMPASVLGPSCERGECRDGIEHAAAMHDDLAGQG